MTIWCAQSCHVHKSPTKLYTSETSSAVYEVSPVQGVEQQELHDRRVSFIFEREVVECNRLLLGKPRAECETG